MGRGSTVLGGRIEAISFLSLGLVFLQLIVAAV